VEGPGRVFFTALVEKTIRIHRKERPRLREVGVDWWFSVVKGVNPAGSPWGRGESNRGCTGLGSWVKKYHEFRNWGEKNNITDGLGLQGRGGIRTSPVGERAATEQ